MTSPVRFPFFRAIVYDIGMTRNIGVDTVYIPRIKKLLDNYEEAFFRHTFTEAENRNAPQNFRKAEYYAGRFAAKEAVYKALAPLLKKKHFDLRIVETLHHEDGSPYIHITEEIEALMKEAEVSKILLSVTGEQDYATAFVIIE